MQESTGRILLVDDDELVAGSLRRYLDVRGRTCDVAGERELAVALMEARRYAVVVVDPYLTGSLAGEPAALLATVRTLQPEAAIVVLTAYASPELKLLGGAYGVSAMVAKPQPVTTLTLLLDTHSARNHAARHQSIPC